MRAGDLGSGVSAAVVYDQPLDTAKALDLPRERRVIGRAWASLRQGICMINLSIVLSEELFIAGFA